MITSACGPAAMASATAAVDRAADGHDARRRPTAGRTRGPARRPRTRSASTAAPHGLACLMMATAGSSPARAAQLVHQAPGGVGVEEVEVGELLARRAGRRRPTTSPARHPVAGAVLVRVLAVAERPGALEGQVDRLGQQGRPSSVASTSSPVARAAGSRSSSQATMAAS